METFVPFREPPETDLEYYSRPENYTGSNLTSLSRFIAAKRQESAKISSHKSDPGRQTVLAERYNERTHSYTSDSSLLHPPNTQGDEREPEVFLADPQNEHQTSNTKPNYENLETKGRKSESRTGKGCKLTHSDASEDGGLWSTDKVSKKIERKCTLPTDGNGKRFTNGMGSTDLDVTPDLKRMGSTDLDVTPDLKRMGSTDLDMTPDLKGMGSTGLDVTPDLKGMGSTDLDVTPDLKGMGSTDLDVTPDLKGWAALI
ncbi:CAunnamed protein product [Biomphalaria glabrata]|nr:CAunnamed protein product [Biomphalaria glabrata]